MYTDAQTQGLAMGGHPRDTLCILGVRGYSDTGIGHGGHPRIIRDTLGVRGYSDTGGL